MIRFQVWYLSCVMQYPLYGCTLFPATYRGYWQYGSNIVLGVNADGILLIRPNDKGVLFEFTYPEIESLLLDPSDNFITLNLARHPNQVCVVILFHSPQNAFSI